jgi:ribosome silencing factor RsfS/YbeB/iojap
LIESQELKDFLEQNGGENVVILKLERPLVDIAEFVIATFPSTRLIRNAANAIKENLKDRELFHVMGAHEIEGKKDEEWQAVDCQTTLVHLFLPEIRGHIDLEGHWSSKERPVVSLSLDEVDFDRKMEELLDQYPTPKDYLKEKDAKSTFKGFDQEVKSL